MEYDFQFSAGHRLDDYRIEAPIYKGALAEVYRAVHRLTGDIVALKAPSSDIINHPLVYYHYQNEMRILAGLDHPCVVRAIEHERTSAYSIFEYIEGLDLRRQLRASKRLSIVRALDYTLQIVRGLSYLHDCGIIHLDIKPENILITPSERVKIIDFGLARHLGAPDLLFEDFVRAHGTPDYVSPEQFAHHRDDRRSDQYSLALILYEMLTGRLPYEKSSRRSSVRRRFKTAPLAPRRLREEIPAAMETVILKALAVDPQVRYPSMAVFGKQLQTAGRAEGKNEKPSLSSVHRRRTAAAPQCPIPPFMDGQPRILAAIADDEYADAVAGYAFRAALADGLPVTILTAVCSDVENDWVRYGDASRGKQLSRQLARLTTKFRDFGIDPSVRIRTGTPADIIARTAHAVGAELIVMGPSHHRWLTRIMGRGTVARVKKNSSCRVAVVEKIRPLEFPEKSAPAALTLAQIHQAEIFLTALWIERVDWLAERVQRLLAKPDSDRTASQDRSRLFGALQQVRSNAEWVAVFQLVGAACDQLRDAVLNMEMAATRHGMDRAGGIFLRDALPLICRLRDQLGAVRTGLRSLCGMAQAPSTGLLSRPACPLDERLPTGSGPIQRLQMLQAYFCGLDGAPRQHCLEVLNAAPQMTA